MDCYYIDLEGTVIDSWQSPIPINLHLRNELQGKEVIIYSFALLGQEDMNHFDMNIRNTIEQTFSCKVKGVVFTGAVCDILAKEDGVIYEDEVDRILYRSQIGKTESFLRYIFENGVDDNTYHLFDDTVEDRVIDNVRFYKV